jgi:hypothetical protein
MLICLGRSRGSADVNVDSRDLYRMSLDRDGASHMESNPQGGVRGAVERKTGLMKHFGDSGYDGRGKLTAFRSPFSLVRAHSAQLGHPPRCRSVAKMGSNLNWLLRIV